ncbi:sugar kinase [Microbacteriaceae bacterium VKM Ac-2855]|nr:sugar kinase [Microbacteriaceae bacterium VKM Ac-2855]
MSVLTVGETMALVRAAELGGLEHVTDLKLGIGGAESNVAIGLARLGHRITWLGRVGDDGLGRRIRRELLAEGIDARAVTDPRAPTGLMVKESRTATSTRVSYYRRGSAGSRLRVDDIDLVDVASYRLVHITGITPSLSPTARQAVDLLLERANAADVPVSFDVNHRSALWAGGDPGELYRSIAARSSIVFAGDDEARLLVDSEAEIAALTAAIAALGPAEVVIKLGAAGAAASVDGVDYSARAVPIEPVDTVGAGDAFVAGYLAEWLDGSAPEARLATAVRTGAFACLNPGDWEGYARREELTLLTATDPVSR